MIDVELMDGLALAKLVRTKQVSPHELLDAAIERIERANPAVNAVVTAMYDEARHTLAGPLPDGPFTGVPFLLKDGGSAAYAGVRLTSGSRYLLDYIAPADGELTRRYKAAGLVACGKTNLPEFGLQPTTEPEALGPTRNPWDTERTPGGSSGGAAAAVATRMVPMANGSDSGGSIRVPASCCGVFGMKPTRSRMSGGRRSLGVSMRAALLSENCITLSVRDSAALLDATAGPIPGDAYVAPPPPRPYLEEIGADPGQLRIVFSRESPTGAELHADCLAAVEDAARLCESLGHHVQEGVPHFGLGALYEPFAAISSVGVAWDVRNWERLTGKPATIEQFELNTWTMIDRGRNSTLTAEGYMDALVAMQGISDQLAAFQ